MAKVSKKGKMRKSYGKSWKKRQALSKKQASAVKSIVKRTVNTVAETKHFVVNVNQVIPVNYQFTSYNLFYQGASEGTSDNRYIGDEVIWRGLKVNYQIINQVSASAINDQPFQFKFMIVSTPVYKAVDNLVIADIRDQATSAAGRFFLKSDAKIHYQKVINFNVDRYYPSGSGKTLKTVTGNFWFGRNQKIKFKDLGVNYALKDRNYYLVLFPMTAVDILGEVCSVAFTYKNYFKDP